MRNVSLRIVCVFLLILGGAAPLTAAETPAADSSAGPICADDFRGRQICLAQPARRVVCLIESALSGIFMLGVQHRVVGVSTNVYQDPVFPNYAAMDPRIVTKSLPTPGNWDFVNLESLVALQPDLVIIWSHQEESIRAIEQRGIPVFGVFIRTFADIKREIEALGLLLGASGRAEELVRIAGDSLAELKAKLEEARTEKPPRVYYMWSQGDLETSGHESTVQELIDLAGGENVCGGMAQEHLVVSRETLLALNPEVVVMWFNDRKDPRDVMAHPAWQSVSAVQNGKVHEFPDTFSCDLWTLKYIHAVMLVARWCHPKLFESVDMERERAGLFRALYGDRFCLPGMWSASPGS
jgi:iron complex transport system substrate-binding protein